MDDGYGDGTHPEWAEPDHQCAQSAAATGDGDFPPGTVQLFCSSRHSRLVLSGDLDEQVARELGAAVNEAVAAGRPVQVDARQVRFMNSSALAMLARLAQRCEARPVVISPPEILRFLLEVTRVGELVSVAEEDPGFEAPPAAAELTGVGARQSRQTATDVPAQPMPRAVVPLAETTPAGRHPDPLLS